MLEYCYEIYIKFHNNILTLHYINTDFTLSLYRQFTSVQTFTLSQFIKYILDDEIHYSPLDDF